MNEKSIKSTQEWIKESLPKHKLPVDRLIALIYKKNQDSIMYARYKDRHFYAKIDGENAILWRPSKVFDWDQVLCSDGSKKFKKRFHISEINKFFFAQFFVVWNDMLCKATLSKNKKYIRLYLEAEHEEFALTHKFKWNKKLNNWITRIPVDSCEKYILKTLEVYPRINRKRTKSLSKDYWIEMYEKLNWDILEELK